MFIGGQEEFHIYVSNEDNDAQFNAYKIVAESPPYNAQLRPEHLEPSLPEENMMFPLTATGPPPPMVLPTAGSTFAMVS